MSDNKIPGVPEVKFNKNGYEIRSDILGLANQLVLEEYKMKFAGWEMQQYRDPETNQVIARIDMPEFPGLDKVLETAQKMYEFVNNPGKTK
jgi:hypothetical protein